MSVEVTFDTATQQDTFETSRDQVTHIIVGRELLRQTHVLPFVFLTILRYRYEPIGYGFEELRDLKLDEQPILIVVNYFFYSEFLWVW